MLTRRHMLCLTAAAITHPAAGHAVTDVSGLVARLGRPLRVLVPNGSQANLAPIIRSFETRFACPVMQVVTDVDNINATLAIEAVTQGQQIDVALPATFGIPDLVEVDAIRPLDEFANIYEPSRDAASMLYRTGDVFDDQKWGYQTDGDVYMMFYHRDLIESEDEKARFADQFGKPLILPQDWDDFDQQLAYFHRPAEGVYGGCLFRTAIYAAWEWWARFHAKGVWPFSPSMTPQIDGEAGVEALEAMIRSGAHLTGSDLGLFDNWARYKKGDIYASIGWGGTQKSLRAPGSEMRGRVIPARLPCGLMDGKHVGMSYFNWGWSYVVTRHSPAPELAYLFSRHAVSGTASGQAVAERDGFFDPFREEHYDNPQIVDVYGKAFLDEHKEAMSQAIPDLYLARRNEYFEALSFWLDAALEGKESPQDALRHVSNAWRLTTARVGHGAQEARWDALRRRYPADLRSQLRDLPNH
ncbi:MAG: hypothetical protein AAFW87_11135 [Pseudomonadota bacterium]